MQTGELTSLPLYLYTALPLYSAAKL